MTFLNSMNRRQMLLGSSALFGGLAMPAIVRGQGVTNIRLAHHLALESEQDIAANFFAQRVSELSGGAVAAQVLPAGQMGGQREIVESVALGTLEMGYGESGLYASYLPRFSVVALPYIYRDFEHWQSVVTGDLGKTLAGELEQASGMRVMNWMTSGRRSTYLRNRAINEPSDFRGVKVRLPEAPVFVRTFSQLGAIPTPIPATEMYSALQSGVVDAMEGSPEVAYTFRIHEVTQYCSMTRHIFLDGSFVANNSFLAGLSDANREAVEQAAAEAGDKLRSEHLAREEGWLEKLAEAGLTINEPNLEAFTSQLGSLQDSFAQESGSMDLLTAIREQA
ncbi:TRAP transporter substrate-binding protein [Devosia sp. 2618]|uniref:TRAP transporter substrate-binding protein n=1 Tax=Devosia sp. 2618 TaxID=3156454 RepID=UPI003393673E